MPDYKRQVDTDRHGNPILGTFHKQKQRPGRAATRQSGSKQTRAGMGIPSEQWIANAAKGISKR